MSLDNHMRVMPTQPRAKERVEAILAAARAHYMEVGRDRFNFDAIAAAAGCSVPTIYRYFPDKVALLDAIFPDRDRAETKLNAIRLIADSSESAVRKWLAVENVLAD